MMTMKTWREQALSVQLSNPGAFEAFKAFKPALRIQVDLIHFEALSADWAFDNAAMVTRITRGMRREATSILATIKAAVRKLVSYVLA